METQPGLPIDVVGAFPVELAVAVFCGAVVLLFAVHYFNRPDYPFADHRATTEGSAREPPDPALPRYMTSRSRYVLALIAFLAFTAAAYIILWLALREAWPSVRSALSASLPLPSWLSPVLTALIMTGLAWTDRLPLVQTVLGGVRRALHRYAGIPRRGRELYELLRGAFIDYRAETCLFALNDPRFTLGSAGATRSDLSESDFEAAPASLPGRWARLCYLISAIEHTDEFRRFRNEPRLQVAGIVRTYEELAPLVVQARDGKLDEDATAGLLARIDRLTDRVHQLASCLILLSMHSSLRQEQYLAELGIDQAPVTYVELSHAIVARLSLAVVLAIIGGIVVGRLTSMAVLGLFAPEQALTTDRLLRWIFYGLCMQVLPVLAVLQIKRHAARPGGFWPAVSAATTARYERPWDLYLVMAALGWAIDLVVLIVLSIVLALSPWVALSPAYLARFALWALLGAITGLCVAHRVDSVDAQGWGLNRSTLRRVNAALTHGTLSAIAAILAYTHSANGGSLDVSALFGRPEYAELITFTFIAFFMGVGVNLTAHLRRRHVDQRSRLRHPAHLLTSITLGPGAVLPATVVDWSEGGMCLAVDATSGGEVGQVVTVSFGDTVLHGQVVGAADGELHVRLQDRLDRATWTRLRALA